MAKQKQNGEGKRSTDRKDPNKDVQPWLGWVAAAMVVLIVVVAVAMGLERSNRDDSMDDAARLTPIVGGMAVATESDASINGEPEVTLVVTDTGSLTATVAATDTTVITTSMVLSETKAVTETATVSDTVPVTDSSKAEEPTAAPIPTVEPTATLAPTAVPTRSSPPPSFEAGDMVVNESDEVALHADTTQDSLILDTVNAGVALTIIEPSGPDLSYPVENEGYGWVRVRSSDGLVGWTITDGLSRVP